MADSYLSHLEAFHHASAEFGTQVECVFFDSEKIEQTGIPKDLASVDGILIPGGFGNRGVNGKILTAKFARENYIPFLGVCLGFQVATMEIARNLANLDGANSTEFDPDTKYPVVDLLPDQVNITDMGATMRLGAQKVIISEGSNAHELYGALEISERHRHRYEVNPEFIDKLESVGWKFTGKSEDGIKMEIAELEDHPYFMASQFHPEFKSRPGKPSPLHLGLVKAAVARRQRLVDRNLHLPSD